MTIQSTTKLTLALMILLLAAPTPLLGATTAADEATFEEVEALLREGQDALSRDQYSEAIEAFRVARLHSEDVRLTSEILYWLAFALYREQGQQNLQEAELLLAQILEIAPDPGTRKDAAELLTRIRGIRARSGDPLAAAQIAALAQRQRQAMHEEQERLSAETERLRAEMHEQAREVLLRRAETEAQREELRQILGLGWIMHSGADDLEDEDIRIAALNALAHTDPDRALPILDDILAKREPGSEKLRRAAILVLAMHETPQAVELILRAAREDPDPSVRAQGINYLGLVGSDEAVAVIEAALNDASEPEIQERAVIALSLLDPEKSAPLLRRAVQNPDLSPALRERIIHALIVSDGEENITFLRTLFDQLDDPALQTAVVMAVGQAGRPETREWLIGLARDPGQPAELRARSFFFLAMDSQISTEALIGLFDALDGSDMRRQAVLAIGQRNDAPATDFIIRIARDETDPELQRAAILWLGQSRDPRAVEVLQELILE
jgi:HEAT repeat protein